MTAQPAPQRPENRRQALLDAAARRFLRHGYAAASMRDIAADVGMQVGSIYYHFPSKARLLTAVHEEGLRRIHAAVDAALADAALADDAGPWERLEAACMAHATVLLEGGDFFQAVMREMPRAGEPGRPGLVALRDAYEAVFARLLDALPLPAGVHRHELRLMLLGALNWSHTWYRPGARSPAAIAQAFVRYLRVGLEPPDGAGVLGVSARRKRGRRGPKPNPARAPARSRAAGTAGTATLRRGRSPRRG